METEIVYGSTPWPTGYNVSSFTMLQIPQFARAVDFLSSNLASFGILLFQNEVKSDDEHDLLRIINRKANQNQSSKAVFRQWCQDGESQGNGYIYARRPSPTSTNIMGLYNLNPPDVTPFKLVAEGDDPFFDAQFFYWHIPTKRAFPAADILHYHPGLSYEGWIGYMPQQLFLETFRRASALQAFQTKYLLKGSMVKASIEVPQTADKDQIKEIVNAMKSFRAETGDKDMILLTGGATMKSQTAPSQQMQLIEQDEAITKKVAMITGLDPRYMFEGAEQKYNAASVEAAGSDLIRFTFRNRIAQIEGELAKLLTDEEQDAGYAFKLDTSDLLKGDTAVEMATATAGVAGGLLSQNEGRAQIGEQPVQDPAADKLLEPTHVASASGSTSQEESETHAADPSTDQYAAFQPLLIDAASRVESKTGKALETAAKKPEAERVIYSNVLADQQASYAIEALSPIGDTLKTITGKTLDVQRIGELYSAEIRRRAAGQEPRELITIVGENIHAAA